VEVEWLILADSAQVVGNKLYLLGGGWDIISPRKDFPFNQRCGIAVAINVAWTETNQKHNFEVEVISEDENTEEPRSVAKMGGQFEVGRPPGIPSGQNQRIQLAIDMGLKVEKPGTKVVIARLNGEESKRISFTVLPAAK
jgi:hypothetical protein